MAATSSQDAPGAPPTLPSPPAKIFTRAAALCAKRVAGTGATTDELEAIIARGAAQAARLLAEGQRRDEVEAAVEQLGLEAAIAECAADAGSAFRGRRIGEPPTSLGFFAHRLISAAARRGRSAAGGAP